jgi:7,8-dihydropterin-6-yl-methyl-4-(beta-D-ribofuranosyl)aminobenzene 5'-phosphate synthase
MPTLLCNDGWAKGKKEMVIRVKSSLRYLAVALALLLVAGCATLEKLWPDNSPKAQITILYDAFGKPLGMKYDWGYAALIEYGGKRILFDTGDNPEILKKNAKIKGVDLSKLDFVVISHRHGDHIGGMSYLLDVNPKVKIYAPKENFGVFGYSLPSTFFRKEEALTPDFRYYSGYPPTTMKFGSAWPQANFELVEETTEIAPDIHLISLVSDKPGTQELHELSLAINTPDGIVLIVGCSHPGIEKIVAAAAAINKHIHLVAGGFHMVVAKDAEIEKVTTSLHDTWKVDYLAPGHCTGEPAFLALRRAFGDRYIYAGLGSQITLGAMPHLVVDK